jgi:hypothetical protein
MGQAETSRLFCQQETFKVSCGTSSKAERSKLARIGGALEETVQ